MTALGGGEESPAGLFLMADRAGISCRRDEGPLGEYLFRQTAGN